MMTDNNEFEIPNIDVEDLPTSDEKRPVEQAKCRSDHVGTIELMEETLKESDAVERYPDNWAHSPTSQERIPRIVTYAFESDGDAQARLELAVSRVAEEDGLDCEETIWNQVREAYTPPGSKEAFELFIGSAVGEYEGEFPMEGDNE